jgi:hypothetical protein
LGNPRTAEAAPKAHAANRAAADRFAANVLPIIREIQSTGRTTLRAIAARIIRGGVHADAAAYHFMCALGHTGWANFLLS